MLTGGKIERLPFHNSSICANVQDTFRVICVRGTMLNADDTMVVKSDPELSSESQRLARERGIYQVVK